MCAAWLIGLVLVTSDSSGSSATALLVIGLLLLALSPVYYRFEPRFSEQIRRWLFSGKPTDSRFQQVGGAVLLAVIGLFAIAGSIFQFATH